MRQTGGPARSREGYHWFRGWRKPTAAQRRVLDELVAGGTNAQIAARLGISEDGVKWHLSELRDETGLGDRRELAAWWEEEQKHPAVNLLLPFTALWRFASQNTAATAVVAGVLAASLAAGWLAYDSLRGDDDGAVSSAAPVETPERAAAVPFVPTPTPTPAPLGALVFDMETGESHVLPGEYIDRRWLDTEAETFTFVSGKATIIDAEGNVTKVAEYEGGVQILPDTDNGRVVVWDWDVGTVEVFDAVTLEVIENADFGYMPGSQRYWAVSPAAGKLALTVEPEHVVTTYNLDGSNPQEIFTTESGRLITHMEWSRDGEWLLVLTADEASENLATASALVFDAEGSLVMKRDTYADWAGTRALRLYLLEGASLIPDSVIDLAHGSQIPLPEGDLLCISPDARYAVVGERVSSTFGGSTEHRIVDLVTHEVVASTTVTRYLVNCDWTPDGSKVVLSAGGK